MQVFTYYGCQDHLRGDPCIVIGQFESQHQDAEYREWLQTRSVGRLDDDTKYRVRFRDGGMVNVYGRNLRRSCVTNEQWPEKPEYSHPKPRDVYPYVIVQLICDSRGKRYHYLNADVALTERDLVVVQARDGYQIARVWGCYFEFEIEEKGRGKFEHAYAYVEHRIDEDRMAKIRERDHLRKELDRKIKARLKVLRDSIEVERFISQDDELAKLVEEKNNLTL